VAANLQISLDLIALTLVLHFAGGIENPVAFFFLLHVSFASILLSRRATFLQSGLAILLYSGLIIGERYGWWPHHSLQGLVPPGLHQEATLVWGTAGIFAAAVSSIAVLATTIVGRLRQREEDILKLSQELRAHTDRLESAYDQLTGIERAKSDYLRKVSHELRSPLAALQTSLRVVLEGIAGPLPEKARGLLESSELASGRVLRLVEDLLILSRAREMRLMGEFVPVEVNEAIRRVAELQRPRANRDGVTLRLDLRDGLPPVLGEPESVQQLLTNLLANAIKYTPAGGRVSLSASRDGDQVVISVSDTGIGITPSEVTRIFEDFYRAPAARELTEVGTGLGLSIVKSIVASHQGRVDVDSRPGKGSTFLVWLPIARSDASGMATPAEKAPASTPA
jgi:signal transduction histidine kinase